MQFLLLDDHALIVTALKALLSAKTPVASPQNTATTPIS